MTRTRSEYRIAPIPNVPQLAALETSHPSDSDRDALATVLLAAYRGTVDDEGEELVDAYVAIDTYLARILRPHSFVVSENDAVVAFSFVLIVDAVHFIDPVVVAPSHKGQGLGRDTVRICLGSLARAGVNEVGATITDGNLASERLFLGLGFSRCGAWS